jgi:hypothetical protein
MTADTAQLDTTGSSWTARAGGSLRKCAQLARNSAARAVAWTWTPALPGAAGITLLSASAGGIVAEAAGTMLGLWAGLGALGLFLLRIDGRMS